jgi:non-homologous end joining protein Ku
MAEAAKRSSANTELYVGTLKMDVGLFGTNAKPAKTQEFDTAGPNGGRLKFEMRGVVAEQAPEDEPDAPVQTSDPLAMSDPGSAAPHPAETTVERAEQQGAAALMQRTEPGALVDGEFRRVLVEEGSGEVVEADQVRKGVRLDDGRFIDCTDQLDAIDRRTKLDRIDVVRCIDSTQIRRERVIGGYYVGGQATEDLPKLRLLYEALRKRREVAVVKYTTRSRQQIGVVAPNAKTGTLILQNLVWADDWRDAPARAHGIAKVQVNEQHVEAMCSLLEALHGHVDDLDELRDDAIALREELKTRALAGELAEVVEPVAAEEPAADLEGVLAASLEAVRAGKV